jgi:hypothetical protein
LISSLRMLAIRGLSRQPNRSMAPDSKAKRNTTGEAADIGHV